MVVIGESVSINSSQWEDLLHQYFSYINQGNYTAIVQMHHPDLQEDLNSTYMNIKNIQNHMGVSNIENAKVEDITMLNTQQIERIVSKMADVANLQQYEAYTAIIISVDLKVYTTFFFYKNDGDIESEHFSVFLSYQNGVWIAVNYKPLKWLTACS